MFDSLIDTSLGSVARLLGVFYELPVINGSFGLAIIMLTLTVMVLLMPLTLKATKSTIKMTQLQPKLRELQKKYKDDKQQLNAEMMAMYQSEGVNPVGGCLPMLAQLPVFLVLFNVLRGLARRVSDEPYFAVADQARTITGRASEINPETFAPQYLNHDSQMYLDLTDGRTSMDFGPFDLALSTWEVVQDNFVTSLPYLVLIAFVVGSSYYQQRQISARRTGANEQLTPQQQTQQQLLKILPLMSGAWSFVFPAGLVLYWATSNLFRIGQQAYITRSLYTGDAPGAKMLADQEARRAEAETEDVAEADDEDEAATASTKTSQNKNKGGGKGKSGKSGVKSSTAGAASSNGSGDADAAAQSNGAGTDDAVTTDREKRWAERRAQKAKIQARRSAASGSGSSGSSSTSSRLTPKGTKPASSKKNKRKR